MVDLKPCPFCGGKAEIGTGPGYSFVNCTDCMASTDILLAENWKYTALEAADRWNMRTATS